MRGENMIDLLSSRNDKDTLGWHTGVVLAWDALTGLNSIEINGQVFNNLNVLSTGDSILLAVDDVVGVLRVGSQYFILGRIAAPGSGAVFGVRTDSVDAWENVSTGSSFVDLDTPGPEVTVPIGSSRRCLVWMSALMDSNAATIAFASARVRGASTIEPSEFQSLAVGNSDSGITYASMTRGLVINADDGLNEGMNTFRMQYKTSAGGGICGFRYRQLIVLPY